MSRVAVVVALEAVRSVRPHAARMAGIAEVVAIYILVGCVVVGHCDCCGAAVRRDRGCTVLAVDCRAELENVGAAVASVMAGRARHDIPSGPSVTWLKVGSPRSSAMHAAWVNGTDIRQGCRWWAHARGEGSIVAVETPLGAKI